jgi:ABC-type oligopeptide transport system substrate-binding subunit
LRNILSFVAALLALTACQGAPQRPACPEGQVCLEYGNNAEPQTLDPHKANLIDEAAVIGDLIMGLTTDGPDAAPAWSGPSICARRNGRTASRSPPTTSSSACSALWIPRPPRSTPTCCT